MSTPASLSEPFSDISRNFPAEEWRLLHTAPSSGAFNMALDEILLEAVEAGRSKSILRLYGWAPPAVTIGYAQSISEVNQEACRSLGYDIVRRPTGGRAVLHDHECTYAVIAGRSAVFPDSLFGSYRIIAGVLQETLGILGVPTELVDGRRRGSQPGICFTAPGYGELLCNGFKVTGGSQKRLGRAFLQHGSLPLGIDLQRLWQVLGHSRAPSRMQSEPLMRTIGWLNRFLPKPVAIADVEKALIAAFTAVLRVRFLVDAPTSAELEAARQLATQKYTREEWTVDAGRSLKHATKTFLNDNDSISPY